MKKNTAMAADVWTEMAHYIIIVRNIYYYITLYKCASDTQRATIKYNADRTPHDSVSTIITTTRRCIIAIGAVKKKKL